MKIEPYQLGDEIVVRHQGGSTMTAYFAGVLANGLEAFVNFGTSGDRKVWIKDTAKKKRGTFVGRWMCMWYLDHGTVERIAETHRLERGAKGRER